MIGYPFFPKNLHILPTPPFSWKKFESPLFGKILKTQNPSFYKGRRKFQIWLFLYSWLIALSTSFHQFQLTSFRKWFLVRKLHISHVTLSNDMIYHLLFSWTFTNPSFIFILYMEVEILGWVYTTPSKKNAYKQSTSWKGW